MNFRRLFTTRHSLQLLIYMTALYYAVPYFFNIAIRLYTNFLISTISFDLDTLFLNWNTSFPAITVCEIYDGEKIWDYTIEKYGPELNVEIDDFIGEIVFYGGDCKTCESCDAIDCPTDFHQLLEMFRRECDGMIVNCSYSDDFFNCCDHFLPIRTEYGICYAFNSIQAEKKISNRYVNNRVTGAGQLKFETSTDVQIYIHAPIEIPFLYSEGIIRETALLGNVKEFIVNVMDLYNHPNVYDMPINNRRCRFPNEKTDLGHRLGIYEFYSLSTCIIECTIVIHLDMCNCTNHFLSSKEKAEIMPMCDYKGLLCLGEYSLEIQSERRQCNCLSSCEEPEYNIVYNSVDSVVDTDADSMTQIEVSMVGLPTERYVRRVIKTYMDLIISIGGLVGLFFNVSIVKIVEYIYFIWQFNWRSLFITKA